MTRISTVTLSATLVFAGVMDAQLTSATAETAIVRGSCSELTIGGEKQAKACRSELANVNLDDGTVMFIFSTADRMIAFSGSGDAVRPQKDGSAVLPLQFVNIGTSEGRPDVARAMGQCQFTDPYVGRPASIRCSAKSQFGTIRATFKTDGRPPRER